MAITLSAHLRFNGDCEEALRFYEKALGAKVESIIRYEGSPAAAMVPPAWGQKVLHAAFTVGGVRLGAADAPPGRYEKPQGLSITLELDSAALADRLFGALADGGTAVMPCQKTFFAEKFAMVADRYGVPWMLIARKA